jgi:hypothetical protein
VTGNLMGWLVINPDGGGQINLIELDARSQPLRLIASETILPTSLAGAARQATAVALRSAAASWDVSAAYCAYKLGRIEHPASGRSTPFAVWADFA